MLLEVKRKGENYFGKSIGDKTTRSSEMKIEISQRAKNKHSS